MNRDISILFEDFKFVEISPPTHTHTHTHPPYPPQGVPPNLLKCDKTWTNQYNSIVFEDLWFVETPPPMGGCVGGWVGQWVGSGQMTNN